ncbi:TPA: phage regulatory CII family protein [Haemophilus influenzae]
MEKSPKPTSCAHSQSHNSATNSKNLQEKGKVLMNSKDIQRTLHRDCKNASGGITTLALTLGKSPNILGNKLNVECENNHLSFIEALDLIEITNSTRTVAAIADKIDHLIVPMPKCASCCADVVQGFLDITTNAGKIGEQIKSAVHPNSDLGRELSNKEKQTISASIDALIESALCLKWELEQ